MFIVFNPDIENQEREKRIKTMKRAAVTARKGNRIKRDNFIDGVDKSPVPEVESYRNLSVNEKRGTTNLNNNALANKINSEEIYKKLLKSDKPMTAQTFGMKTETNFSSKKTHFNQSDKKRP